jgi:hypothetical protein
MSQNFFNKRIYIIPPILSILNIQKSDKKSLNQIQNKNQICL